MSSTLEVLLVCAEDADITPAMRQSACWKYGLFIGMLEILLLTAPARCQQQASPTPPASGADAKAYVEFGIANGAKGDLNAAIAAFNQAISIDPKYAPAYFNLGLAYSFEHKPDEAISEYGRAIQIDPRYRDAFYNRACLRGEKGDFDGALGDFGEVIKLDPKYAPAYYNEAHAHYFKGDLDGALGELDQAVNLDPNSAVYYFIRGLIQHAQGHREEALSDFQKSSSMTFPDAAFWVWITETESGQRDLARQSLSDALSSPVRFKPDKWPSQIGNFLLEKITQDQLILKAGTGADAGSKMRLCQAWFYSAMFKGLAGDRKGAQDCFLKAIATGSTGSEAFVEANRQVAELQKQ